MSLRQMMFGMLLFVAYASTAATLDMASLKVGAVTYSNVSVIGANKTDLYFTHDQGIGNVKLKYLSKELQKRFQYDAEAAAQAERKQTEADIQYQTMVASNMAFQAQKARVAAPQPPPEPLADPVSEKSLLGKAAPALEVEKWIGDKPALEGKCVLVSFWAPWSAPSRQCITNLNTLQKKFADKLVVVGISSSPEPDLAQMQGPKLEFASAVDTKAQVGAAAGITSIPCVMLIDTKGIVRYQGHPAAITEKNLQSILTAPAD